jgi:reductive dehalogenase
MGKQHSTLSRRDFLKYLGLGGVGIGAASVGASAIAPLSPKVRDLDELTSSHLSELKRPWWVKETDKPTTEVDWQMMKRFDYHEVMWAAGLKKALGPEQFDRVFRQAALNRTNWIKENKPGQTLPDVAMTSCSHRAAQFFIGPQTSPTPEDLGVPRWEGTPEENARMVRAFLRMHGASLVTFCALDTNTTEKIFYSYDTGAGPAQGPRLDIIDADQPEDNAEEGYRVIPKKARTVIVYAMRMSDEFIRRPVTQLGARMHGYMYDQKSIIQANLQNFLRTLGYMGIGEAALFNALGVSIGWAVMSGMGEMSRIGHCITPEYGIMLRVQKVVTDLPLAPGKPVNFGLANFCRTCKKCAEHCPPEALSKETEPTWDTRGKPYANPGVKNWYFPQETCNAYIREVNGCARCFGVCPYSHGLRSPIRDLFKASVATNSSLNRFWRTADDILYGTGELPVEKFWELDLPPWGYV